MPKQILFDKEARERQKKGVDIAADAVSATLGYNGKLVLIRTPFAAPKFTKDGITVARDIELKDPIENTGALHVMEAAAKTLNEEGDGTTTTALLTQKIIHEGFQALDNGANSLELVRGIEKGVSVVVSKLKELSVPISQDSEKLKEVAAISANNDMELGALIADAYSKVGKDGAVTVADSQTNETRIEVVEGLKIDKGYISQYFVNNPKLTCELINPYVLIYDKTISAIKDELLPILEQVARTGRPLFVIAEDVNGDALKALLENHAMNIQGKGGFQSCAVKMPYGGSLREDIVGDIAAITSASVISGDKGNKLSRVVLSQLGEAEKIVVSKDATVIVGGKTSVEKIEERKLHVQTRLLEAGSEYDKLKQEERLSKLSGGVGVIYVGAVLDSELKEKKDRADDSVRATKSALQGGVIVGGGTSYIRCLTALEEIKGETESEQIGIDIIKKVMEAPLHKIVSNGGYDSNDVVQKVKENIGNIGYNAKTHLFEDLMEAGVIDPTKVAIACVVNASSVANMLIRSGVLMIEC